MIDGLKRAAFNRFEEDWFGNGQLMQLRIEETEDKYDRFAEEQNSMNVEDEGQKGALATHFSHAALSRSGLSIFAVFNEAVIYIIKSLLRQYLRATQM